MRTGLGILIGAGALSLVLAGSVPANAAISHHHRARSNHSVAAPMEPAESAGLSTIGNNPAKRYPARHAPEGAVLTSTLMRSGNNPAKQYSARHAPKTAVNEQTLLTNGNNPARKAAAVQ